MVVSLPAIHLIRRAFPDAELRLLTDYAVGVNESDKRAVPAQDIVMQSGMFGGWFAYPNATRDVSKLLELRKQVRTWRPDVLAYMSPFPSSRRVWRDLAFFKFAGIPRILGAPVKAEQRNHVFNKDRKVFESEASRLVRCFASLGSIDLRDTESWDLQPTRAEKAAADACLDGWEGRGRFLAINTGTKVPANDWGLANWRAVLEVVSPKHPYLGLAVLGAQLDRDRATELMEVWGGPCINLCGMTTPRVSFLVLKQAQSYLGHDSGPMHLAAAAGTPCVCVFSRHNLPGWWFPPGDRHSIFYPYLSDGTLRREEAGVHDIQPEAVAAAVLRNLEVPAHAQAS